MESTEDAYEESQDDKELNLRDNSQLGGEDRLMLEGKKPSIQTMISLREGLTNKFPFLYLKDAKIFSTEYLQTKLITDIDEEATESTPEDGETDSEVINKEGKKIEYRKINEEDRVISFWLNSGRAVFSDFVFSYQTKSRNYKEFPFESFKIIGCTRNEQNKGLNAKDSNERLRDPNSYSKFDQIYIQWGSEQELIRQFLKEPISHEIHKGMTGKDDLLTESSENKTRIIYHPIYINNPLPSKYSDYGQDKPIDYWLGCPNEESEKIFYNCFIFELKLKKEIDYSNFKLLVKGVNIEGDYKILSFI
jgi:hypothetical protein